MAVDDELANIAAMYERGLLTPEEFTQAKRMALGTPSAYVTPAVDDEPQPIGLPPKDGTPIADMFAAEALAEKQTASENEVQPDVAPGPAPFETEPASTGKAKSAWTWLAVLFAALIFGALVLIAAVLENEKAAEDAVPSSNDYGWLDEALDDLEDGMNSR